MWFRAYYNSDKWVDLKVKEESDLDKFLSKNKIIYLERLFDKEFLEED